MPESLKVTRRTPVPPSRVFRAWTDPEQYKKWFLARRIIMHQGVDGLFWFQTELEGRIWPHYGRFLRLEEARLVEMTWMSEARRPRVAGAGRAEAGRQGNRDHPDPLQPSRREMAQA